MIRLNAAAGGAVCVALFAVLPSLLGRDSEERDLVATAPARYQLGAVSAEGLQVGTEGAVIQNAASDGAPGVHLTTAQRTYGKVYEREVTWPSIVGPFRRDSEFVCGYDMYIGAGLFERSVSGPAIESAVRESLSSLFPSTREIEGISIELPALDTVELSISPREGSIDLALRVRLVDRTEVELAFPAWLTAKNGAPALQRITSVPLVARFEGPTKQRIIQQAREYGGSGGALGGGVVGCALGPVGCLLGILFGGTMGGDMGEAKAVERILQTITSEVDDGLAWLSLGLSDFARPFHSFPDRPADAIRLWLERHPIVTTRGISLPLCVQMVVGEPKVDAAIPGPITVGADRLAHRDTGSREPIVAISLNVDAVNQVLHYLWQSGQLRELGQSSAVLDALSEKLQIAAFNVTGLHPELPPTVVSQDSVGDSIGLRFGNLNIGTLDRRTVMAHGGANLAVAQQNDTIAIQSFTGNIHVNCIETVDIGIRLTPCLSDLVPVVRSLARGSTEPKTLLQVSGSDLLAKLPSLGVGGMSLELSELSILAHADPVQLDLRVTAQPRYEGKAARVVDSTDPPARVSVLARCLLAGQCRGAPDAPLRADGLSTVSTEEYTWR